MRARNLLPPLTVVALALAPAPAGSNASCGMPEVSLAAAERAIERAWAAAETARKLEELHRRVLEERERLRIQLAEVVERLGRLAAERSEAEQVSRLAWKVKEISRELLATAVLEELRRSRRIGSSPLIAPVVLRGEVPVRPSRVTAVLGADELRGLLLQLEAEIAGLSRVAESVRAESARADVQVETVGAELREARFRLEDAERRRIATGVSFQRRALASDKHFVPRLAGLPPPTVKSGAGNHGANEHRFRLPLCGSFAWRLGDRREGPRSRGLVLSADQPQPVLAPGRGLVVYAGSFRDMGLLLIIDHGDAYHSLVIGASRLEVQAGDVVTEGEPVGWLERSPSGSMDLYFELRRVGEPVDPMPVLSAHHGEVEG